MPFCNRFTRGDKYDRSVEVFVSTAAIGDQFIIQRTGPGWIVSKYVESVVKEQSPVEKPGNKEKKDAKQGISTAGRKTSRRRGGVSKR